MQFEGVFDPFRVIVEETEMARVQFFVLFHGSFRFENLHELHHEKSDPNKVSILLFFVKKVSFFAIVEV